MRTFGGRAAREARRTGGVVLAWCFAAMALLASTVVLAQGTNSIENVTVTKGASGRTVVRFLLKSPLGHVPKASRKDSGVIVSSQSPITPAAKASGERFSTSPRMMT